ncbi:dienelactone hydrolase family protein [Hymenobacter sp. DG25B]|uniref:dienelactone hydrolase family protein n=1 Tax=Hymenobacter sp. DG25B TaxID=1385664 RepID=UPI0005C8D26E|nr:DeoR family transcriptional regulator [Hymenobacter sp. DG25B]
MTYDFHKLVEVPVNGPWLTGELILPTNARALVIFSHGSGSSRLSSRNNFVATVLHQRGIGTFLFDLLTKIEDTIYANRFDIPLLTQRLVAATEFLDTLPSAAGLPFGYFGASTGAASALGAAALLPNRISAVVSRGGRPDITGPGLAHVQAATLLIVGSLDAEVLALNEEALAVLPGTKRLAIIPSATHLFEEPGALNQVAELAADWFSTYLLAVPQLTN